ncbi:unnamed protein product [Cladocopium goreaui]|uniref:Aminomethyltransferase, mitochondrial (Glycin e cleavage system T protein) (GCVT) n=1 Tax=Cladocopium goreaui TaxID=2562237 RepID=A0A9P1BQA6_9DINO|nr:unnamed protein product [Cladocopium goreaui]
MRCVVSRLPCGRRWKTSMGRMQLRRMEFEEKAYPRLATHEPKRLPRRGRRGGWMQDPQMDVPKYDGTNSAQRQWFEVRKASIDEEFVSKLQADTANIQEILDQHLEAMDRVKVATPPADSFRLPHIQRLAKTPKVNPVHEAHRGTSPPVHAPLQPEMPEFLETSRLQRRTNRRGRFIGHREDRVQNDGPTTGPEVRGNRKASWLSDSDSDEEATTQAATTQGAPRLSMLDRRRQRKAAAVQEEEASDSETELMPPNPEEAMEPLRQSELAELWSSYGASWVEHNRCVVPSNFADPQEFAGSTLDAYAHTRAAASLFDISFKVCLQITGADREFVADQFLTCNLRAMRSGDVQYACVLDSKALILDDAFVFLEDNAVNVLTSGCHSRQLIDYLGQYVVYVRRSGADVTLSFHSGEWAALALQGPQSREALIEGLRHLDSHQLVNLSTTEEVPLDASVLREMPYMSAVAVKAKTGASPDRVTVLCTGMTGEDGFELIGSPRSLMKLAESLLSLESSLVKPGGLFCLDILRMEAGLPRVGADIPVGLYTPIRAALSWTLDQSKMRSHLMFGWQKLFFQLAKGPKFRRVGLLLDGPAHAGCRVMSNPHRQPMGVVCSSTWSPRLQCRVAQAYVKPEYAKANKHVLITVPYNLPMHKMRVKAIKRHVRSGPLRSAYRRLVAGVVAPLPFVAHSYPEPERQRKAAARLRNFEGTKHFSRATQMPPGGYPRAVQRPQSRSTGEELQEGYEHAAGAENG